MKRSLLLLLIYITAASFVQTPKADDVAGNWYTAQNKAKVQIYRSGNKFFGKITWLKEPNNPDGKPKVDKNNPDASKRANPIVGLQILSGFVFEDDEWVSGDIYDPENGKTYSCKMSMPDKNTLKVRGYIGISLFGRTETWKRE